MTKMEFFKLCDEYRQRLHIPLGVEVREFSDSLGVHTCVTLKIDWEEDKVKWRVLYAPRVVIRPGWSVERNAKIHVTDMRFKRWFSEWSNQKVQGVSNAR